MRREAFTRAGHYDEEIPYGYAEDYDWVLRASNVAEPTCLPQTLALYRVHPSSKTGDWESRKPDFFAEMDRINRRLAPPWRPGSWGLWLSWTGYRVAERKGPVVDFFRDYEIALAAMNRFGSPGPGTAVIYLGGGVPKDFVQITATTVTLVNVEVNGIDTTDDNSTKTCAINGGKVGAQIQLEGSVSTVSGTSFNDTGLSGNTTYSYRVRATDAAGNLGPYSNVAAATTLLL